MSDKKPTVRKTRASRRGKQLSSTEKAEAIALWRAGSVTLDELAARFHRDRTTFIRLFNSEGVTKGEARAEHEKKVAEAVETALVTDAMVLAQRIKETKEETYKTAKLLTAQNWNIIVKAREEKRAIGTALNDLKALQVAAQTFRITREERYAVLGLNEEKREDDTPMPDLIVKELTADEIKKMQQQAVGDDDDLGFVPLDELGSDIEAIDDGT